eukprot:5318781-Ditylum_brightwellii.AAC.1
MADVTANADTTIDYTVKPWSSNMSNKIDAVNKELLCNILHCYHIPLHTYALATLPELDHGLGLFDSSRSAINCFVVPMACAIQYAALGINLGKETADLSAYIQSIFHDWDTSNQRLFRLYRNLSQPILQTLQ